MPGTDYLILWRGGWMGWPGGGKGGEAGYFSSARIFFSDQEK